MRKTKVFFIGGGGVTAQACIRALAEKEIEFVGATGNRRNIGKDIGEIAGCGPVGAVLSPSAELEKLLLDTKPDIVFDMTYNTIPAIYDNAKLCLENGLNYISVGEQCYSPFLTDPVLAAELDAVAKAHNATFLASGSGDVWQMFPAIISACSQSIRHIRWEFWALCDDFGDAVIEDVGIGQPEENWASYLQMEDAPAAELIMRQLTAQLKLTETSVDRKIAPIPAPKDLYYPQTDLHVKQGTLLGKDEIVVVHTEEGIEVEGIIHVKNSEPGETNALVCTIEGEPNFSAKIDVFHGEVSTSTIMVNRIPDVIKAPAGVLTANDLPTPVYQPAKAYLIKD